MSRSDTVQTVRDAQRAEASRFSPGERLLMALELSDVCAQLTIAGTRALEERHAAGTSEKEQRTS